MKTALFVLIATYPLIALADEAPPATSPSSGPAPASMPGPTEVPMPSGPPAPHPGRIRWGVAAGGGTFIPGPMVVFGANARVGWQFNDIFGLSLAGGGADGLWFGGRISATGAAATISAVSYWHIGVEAEAMLGNMFFVAGGPHLLRGGWASVTEGADSSGAVTQSVLAVGGWMPGLDLKIGLGFGKPKASGRRNQFTLCLDTMFAFASPGVYVAQNVDGMGNVTQDVSVKGFAIGITPMLMFGFEMR